MGGNCLADAKADFSEAVELLEDMGDKYGEMHARQGLYECLYQTQPDTAHVASELCMSPTSFRRKIQAATGLTAANYILAIRMDEAKRLLAEHRELTMNDIAQRCGFADNAHFTHAFKRVFGTTPSDYALHIPNYPR